MTNTKEHADYTIAHFKWWAPFYRFIEIFVNRMRKRVVRLVGKSPKKILDVACGPGPQTYQLAKAGHSVIGIDLSPDMLAHAKKDDKLDLKYLEQDATATKFSDSEFDISTISFALHDMPENLAVDVLKEMRRVTKNGGQIIIVDYNEPSNFVARIFLGLSRLWETRYYWHFVQTGLTKYLKAAKMGAHSKKAYLFGNVQLVEISNTK
jgi:demethylmenaquinone methyltransferase/2-methoxy-6-polyprenyl-1,4-benzoquinol methylase